MRSLLLLAALLGGCRIEDASGLQAWPYGANHDLAGSGGGAVCYSTGIGALSPTLLLKANAGTGSGLVDSAGSNHANTGGSAVAWGAPGIVSGESFHVVTRVEAQKTLASALNLSGDFTATFWIRIPAITQGGQATWQVIPFGSSDQELAWFPDDRFSLTIDNAYRIRDPSTVEFGTVTMFTVTRVSGQLRLYRNNALVAGPVAGAQTLTISTIGGAAFGGYQTLSHLNYLAIWTSLGLSDADVAALYALGQTAPPCSPPDMTGPDMSHPPDQTVIPDQTHVDLAGADLSQTPVVTTCGETPEPIWIYTAAKGARIKSPASGMKYTLGSRMRYLFDGGDQYGGGTQKQITILVDGASAGTVTETPGEINHWESIDADGLSLGSHTIGCTYRASDGSTIACQNTAVITIEAPKTYANTVNLGANLVLAGGTLDWRNTKVLGNGFRVTGNAIILTGGIQGTWVTGLGNSSTTCGFEVTAIGDTLIERTTWEATGCVHITQNSGTLMWSENEFRSNALTTYIASNPDVPEILRVDGASTGQRRIRGSLFGGGIVFREGGNWILGGYDDKDGNKFIGPRATNQARFITGDVVVGNYFRHDYQGGWSQGFNYYNYQGTTSVFEHNIVKGGSWPMQNFCGTARWNLFVDSGHDIFRSVCDDTEISRNIIVHANGPDSSFDGVFKTSSGARVKIEHNTIDVGGTYYNGPVIAGAGSDWIFRNNIITGFNNMAGHLSPYAVTGNAGFLATANHNLWYNPNWTTTSRYAPGILAGGGTPGVNDILANPLFVGPTPQIPAPLIDSCIWQGETGVWEILANYRAFYTLSAGSPGVNAGSDGNDIGAVENDVSIPAVDLLGRRLSAADMLTDETQLAAWRAEACSSPSARMVAFTAMLEAKVASNDLTDGGNDYQGNQCEWIAKFALGYKIYQICDPVRAARYADSGLAWVNSCTYDIQRSFSWYQEYIGSGNGVQTQFVISDPRVNQSTIVLGTSAIVTTAEVKGAANGMDITGNYWVQVIQVSNTNGGPADYPEGTSWEWMNNRTCSGASAEPSQLDWSPAGPEPVQGNTYYVSYAQPEAMSGITLNVDYTLTNNVACPNGEGNLCTRVNLTSPLPTDRALQGRWFFGASDPTGRGATLNYQHSGQGNGSTCSFRVDQGYTSRSLAYVSIGLDWLDDYRGFTRASKAAVMAELAAWNDQLRDRGYPEGQYALGSESWHSNYAAGHIFLRVLAALAMAKRHLVDGPRLIAELRTFVHGSLATQLCGIASGGIGTEGEGYGPLAARNGAMAGVAWNSVREFAAACWSSWADQRILGLVHQSVGPSSSPQVMPWGDWGIPLRTEGDFANRTVFYPLAALATNGTSKGIANYIDANWQGSRPNDFFDIVFRQLGASTTNPNTQPLAFLASPTGHLTFREQPLGVGTGLVGHFFCGPMTDADHQHVGQGDVEIWRGSDGLLMNANVWTNNQFVYHHSRYYNLMVLDDNNDQGNQSQVYQWDQGTSQDWFGSPGNFLRWTTLQNDYVGASCDYAASYSNKDNPGVGTALSLTRDFVYDRATATVCFMDRPTSRNAAWPSQLRWHWVNAPTLGTNGGKATRNNSDLHWKTYSDRTISTTDEAVTVNGRTFRETITQQTVQNQAAWRARTCMQVKAGPGSSMDATTDIVATGGMEGQQVGALVILFPTGTTPPAGAVSYPVGAGTVQHRLAGMTPGHTYALTGFTTGSAVADAAGLLSATSNGAGTVVVTP